MKATMLHFAFSSHIGHLRQTQEDAHGQAKEELFVVTDGLGGYPGGEVAAKLAVGEVLKVYEEIEQPTENLHQVIISIFKKANRRIVSAAVRNPFFWGMSTTMVVAVVKGNKWWIGNIGDSRGYLFSQGKLAQVTQDHEDAYGVITRAVGLEEDAAPDIYQGAAKQNDILLLATDGLFNVVSDDSIEEALRDEKNLNDCAERLTTLALEASGPDNVTVCLLSWNGVTQKGTTV